MLMQGQQVEMCYMGIEDSKNAFKKTMNFIANPISSSAGLQDNHFLLIYARHLFKMEYTFIYFFPMSERTVHIYICK